MHALLMLEAASEDLEAAKEFKFSLLKESSVEEDDAKLINLADEEAIELWKQSVVIKVQRCIPSAFRPAVKYNTWAELINYLKEIKKNDVRR